MNAGWRPLVSSSRSSASAASTILRDDIIATRYKTRNTCPRQGWQWSCEHDGDEDEAECGTAFPVPEQVDPQLTDPAESLVIVATFGDTVQASLLKARLEQAGIEACCGRRSRDGLHPA